MIISQNGGQQRAQRSSSSRRQRRRRQLPRTRSSPALYTTSAVRSSEASQQRNASIASSVRPPARWNLRPASVVSAGSESAHWRWARSPRGARVVIGVLIRRVLRRIASRCLPASNDDRLAFVRHVGTGGPVSPLAQQSSPRAEVSSMRRRDGETVQDAEHRCLRHGQSVIPRPLGGPVLHPRCQQGLSTPVVDVASCPASEAARGPRRFDQHIPLERPRRARRGLLLTSRPCPGPGKCSAADGLRSPALHGSPAPRASTVDICASPGARERQRSSPLLVRRRRGRPPDANPAVAANAGPDGSLEQSLVSAVCPARGDASARASCTYSRLPPPD
ncbi:hypothetical protein AURDEDRAFT_178741 [Auricularia subglabra TFB-10046 SS5]|uniref:Uncharacterized protein n=1 Tax=Auricularia subglabra (strain TFB-10046 / SS5) TaxID=717982 RepID=J0WKD8_AURST|nr:hypothetical protein AURDEDRAFT_178741 [Auricularia subglabra TFB-10046 SS5]